MSDEKSIQKVIRCHAGYESSKRGDYLWIETPWREYQEADVCSAEAVALPVTSVELWNTLVARFKAARAEGLAQRFQWTQEITAHATRYGYKHPQEMKAEWAAHVQRIRREFGTGLAAFYIELTLEDLKLMKELSQGAK